MSDAFAGMREDVKAQLLRLKDMTRRTGLLAEPQVLQLRLWPQVVFKEVHSTDVEVDSEGRGVVFLVRTHKPPKGQDRDTRCGALEGWVHTLLGDEWLVTVKTRQKKGGPGKVLYRGNRLTDVPGPAQPKADLPAYEFADALTSFKQYRLRDQAAASAAAAEQPPAIPAKEKAP